MRACNRVQGSELLPTYIMMQWAGIQESVLLERDASDRSWRVLLIGGSSGTGKTRIAGQIGKSLGLPWMQVDDLRMALQHSDVRLPAGTDDLYYFMRTPDVWQRDPQDLCNGLIGVGRVMQVPLEMVINHHVELNFPIVIEGDGILPSVLSRPLVAGLAPLVRAVFIVEPDEAALSRNIAQRGRHVTAPSACGIMRETRSSWLFGQWLAQTAGQFGLPVVCPQPWQTLGARVLEAAKESHDQF